MMPISHLAVPLTLTVAMGPDIVPLSISRKAFSPRGLSPCPFFSLARGSALNSGSWRQLIRATMSMASVAPRMVNRITGIMAGTERAGGYRAKLSCLWMHRFVNYKEKISHFMDHGNGCGEQKCLKGGDAKK